MPMAAIMMQAIILTIHVLRLLELLAQQRLGKQMYSLAKDKAF